MAADVLIRPFRDSDLDAIVELSLRAWEPVFESLRDVLGDPIFDRLHQPDWRTVQADAVRSSCATRARTSSSPSPMGNRSGSRPSR